MHWPQYLFLALLALQVVVHVCHHGEPRDPFNGPIAALNAILTGWLLWMGGFFG